MDVDNLRKRIIEIFTDINSIFINIINNFKCEFSDFSEQELFEDCINTYKNAYKIVLNDDILDGLVLIRNSFELMMMLFGIRLDNNVKEEYLRANSYERYIERKKENNKEKDFLSQSYLRNILIKKYSNIETEYTLIYNTFSQYAHPTFYRNILRFYNKEKIDVTIIFLNIIMILPCLFIEILYNEKILDEENYEDVGLFKYIIERISWIYFINYADLNRLSEANRYLYMNINEDYYKKGINNMKEQFTDMENCLNKNSENISDLLKKLLSKTKYSTITQKIVELKLEELI